MNMLLSIITINYNNCDGLRKTIESVVGQTFRDFEYVIIDGGSTDGSTEVIHEYADMIDYWVSEKDNGIYNAMNKGAFAAHGKYLLFLNSGDILCSEKVLYTLHCDSWNSDIVCGNIITPTGGGMKAPKEVTMEYFLKGSLPHPSAFMRRTLFDIHPYNEQFKIAGDWEFFLHHLIVRNVSYQRVDVDVSVFDTTGISSTTSKEGHDNNLRIETIKEILPPRVMSDYDMFTGKKDEYNRLFYTIGQSISYKKWIYILVLMLLKVVMFNKGWIKSFSIAKNR